MRARHFREAGTRNDDPRQPRDRARKEGGLMFGRKGGRAGEIDVSGFDFLDGSAEFARLWAEPDGPMTCVIEPRALGPDPFLFGMALVDAAQHGAKAYAHALGIPEEQAFARIWQ